MIDEIEKLLNIDIKRILKVVNCVFYVFQRNKCLTLNQYPHFRFVQKNSITIQLF